MCAVTAIGKVVTLVGGDTASGAPVSADTTDEFLGSLRQINGQTLTQPVDAGAPRLVSFNVSDDALAGTDLPPAEAIDLLVRNHCHVLLDHPDEFGIVIHQRQHIGGDAADPEGRQIERRQHRPADNPARPRGKRCPQTDQASW